MRATTYSERRHNAVARLLKIRLRNYPEHVIAQAVREARKVLSDNPGSAYRAIREGELYAWIRMEARPIVGERPIGLYDSDSHRAAP